MRTLPDAELDAAASSQSRARRMRAPLLLGGGVFAATLVLHFRDPHQGGSYGFCPTALLGFDCPGCGGLRAVNHLSNLDLAAALSSNALLVVLTPVAVLCWAVWTKQRWLGQRRSWRIPRRFARFALVVLIVFSIARNLTVFDWTVWLHS